MTRGKNRVVWDTIFRAYFGAARPVFGLDELLGLADGIGLEREESRAGNDVAICGPDAPTVG